MKKSILKLEEVEETEREDYDTPQKLKGLIQKTNEDCENELKTERKSMGTSTPDSKKKIFYDPFSDSPLNQKDPSPSKFFEQDPEKITKRDSPSLRNKNIKKKNSKKKISKETLPFFLFQPDSNIKNSPRSLLPPISPLRKYTLVLDLDETLVHFQEQKNGKNQFLIRPYAQYFLKEMSKWYEIVIFTAALKDYADFILDRLDSHNWISYRLYRRHTYLNGNVYQKDLSRLGRNLSRTLIVDNNPENFQLQPDNGIYIKSWYDDPEDKALFQLAPLLIEIVKKNYEDVRVAMKKLGEKMMKKLQSESYDEGKLFHLSLEPQNGFSKIEKEI